MNFNKFKYHLALLIANIFFGINYLVAKGVMPDYLSPVEIIILRAGGSLLLFSIFHHFLIKERIDKKDILKLALCGLFGVTINQLMFFEGLNLTSPVDASIIMVSNPMLVLLLASLFIGEKLTKNKIIGIIIGAFGAISILIYGKTVSFSPENFTGNILIFINALSYAVYLIIVKPLMLKYKPITVMKWIFLFGFLFVLPFSYKSFTTVNFTDFPLKIWLSILYIVLITTFLAYYLISYSLKSVNASVASFYIYSQPVIAGILSILLGKETISLYKIFSALLIFIGVYLISKK